MSVVDSQSFHLSRLFFAMRFRCGNRVIFSCHHRDGRKPSCVSISKNLLDDEKAQTSNKNCGDNQWNLMQMLPFVFQPLYFNSFFLYF